MNARGKKTLLAKLEHLVGQHSSEGCAFVCLNHLTTVWKGKYMGKRFNHFYLLCLAAALLVISACSEVAPSPSLSFVASPSSGEAPLEVIFDVTTSSTGTFSFLPGDGSAALSVEGSQFSYVYEKAGNYTASLSLKTETADLTDDASISVSQASKEVKLPQLEADAWTQFYPGGDTRCSDGSEYSYYATPGKLNKVVIDFQGGGACWDDYSCSRGATGTYARNVLWMSPETFESGDINFDGIRDVGGIYDRKDLRNPVKDWYHVYVPYCTADVHWGNADHVYTEIAGPNKGKDNLIYHRGAINAGAVLNWVYDNFEAPEDIFITGCSAGAYGSMMWTPHIAKHYPNARIHLMADCGAGVVNEAFLTGGFDKWNVLEGAWPSFIPSLDPGQTGFKFSTTFINDLYISIARAFPSAKLSQFNTMGDGNQIFYYALMRQDFQDTNNDGLDEVVPSAATMIDWLERMPQSMKTIEAKASNFKSYLSMYDDNNDLSDGTGHCIIFRPEFFDVEESGKPLYEWLSDLVNNRSLQSVEPAYVPPYDTIIKSRLDGQSLSW